MMVPERGKKIKGRDGVRKTPKAGANGGEKQAVNAERLLNCGRRKGEKYSHGKEEWRKKKGG